MNALEGLIFRRSVHQRNFGRGAGYPFPMRFTQKLSLTSGVRRDREALSDRSTAHHVERPIHPRGDDWVLDERVGADDVNWFGSVALAESSQRQPDELERCCRVLASAVPYNPGNAVRLIQFL